MKYSVGDLFFSPDSLGDPFGRLFFMDGHVYRLIQKESVESCLELMNSEMIKMMESRGYIPKSRVVDDFEIEGYNLVLEHERIFDTKPYEWSFQMFRDAACFVFQLNSICNEFGFELKDAHPHNVLFKNGRPVMVDFGSFRKKECSRWNAYNEFIHTFYLPLIMWSKGEMYFERLIVENDNYPYRISPHQGPEKSEYVKLLLKRIRRYRIVFWWEFRTKSRFVFTFFSVLKKVLNRLMPSYSGIIKLSCYYSNITIRDLEELNPPRQKYVDGLEEVMPSCLSVLFKRFISGKQSYLDIECGHGVFLEFIDKNTEYERIVAVDSNSDNIDYIYQKYNRESSIIPVLSSIINPPDLNSLVSRIHSEVVVCHGCMEHYLKEGFLLSTICERLNSIADRFLFIVFDKRRFPIDGTSVKSGIESFFRPLFYNNLDSNYFVYIGIKD